MIFSAADTSRPGPGSTARCLTTPFSATSAKRCERVPRPKPLPSSVSPSA